MEGGKESRTLCFRRMQLNFGSLKFRSKRGASGWDAGTMLVGQSALLRQGIPFE